MQIKVFIYHVFNQSDLRMRWVGEIGFVSFLFDEANVFCVAMARLMTNVTLMQKEVRNAKPSGLIYFDLIGLDLLSAEQFPPENLQLLHTVLARLSVSTHDAGAQLV